MTERLIDLMNHEADLLDVPAPSADAVLTRGRTLRRRRRGTQAVAALAALAVVGIGAAQLADGGPGRDAAVDPAATSAADSDLGAAFAVGPTLYLDGGATSAPIDDTAVKSLYYTSAGVLVRHGNNSYSDGGGPQRFSLVTPDGTATPLSLETEETVHATDPTQPLVAYAQEENGMAVVHVRDVTTDEEVALVAVEGASGGFYPLSLDGDHVYLAAAGKVFDIDWRTGDVALSDSLKSSAVAGGHAVAYSPETPQVIDAATGEVLLTAEAAPASFGYFTLSPDGRYAELSVEDPGISGDGPDFQVYDVATGRSITLPGYSYDYGWTADGELFSVSDDGEVTTCVAATGACESSRPDLAVLPNSAPEGVQQLCGKNDRNCRSTQTPDDFSDYLVLGGLEYES